MHTICAQMTTAFLAFSKAAGNDLSTPVPEFGFPGLKDGDFWCLCLPRWIEAYDAGYPPKIKLEACHASVLEFMDLDLLRLHAVA
jgi:uncharacterized protein (DUF2237 family)